MAVAPRPETQVKTLLVDRCLTRSERTRRALCRTGEAEAVVTASAGGSQRCVHCSRMSRLTEPFSRVGRVELLSQVRYTLERISALIPTTLHCLRRASPQLGSMFALTGSPRIRS